MKLAIKNEGKASEDLETLLPKLEGVADTLASGDFTLTPEIIIE